MEAQQVRQGGGGGGRRGRGVSASGADSRHLFFLLRIFFGKNKVMMVALGREPSSEYKENLHKVGAACPKASWNKTSRDDRASLSRSSTGVLTESIRIVI